MTYHNAHAARIEDGIVREVIVIPYAGDDDADITAYCNGIGLAGTWIDTSYTGSRRGKYAGVGDRYDPELDEFVAPAHDGIRGLTVMDHAAKGILTESSRKELLDD